MTAPTPKTSLSRDGQWAYATVGCGYIVTVTHRPTGDTAEIRGGLTAARRMARAGVLLDIVAMATADRLSGGCPMTDVDAIFEAARQLGGIVSAHRAVVRQETRDARDARNARRRAQYAASPPKPRPGVMSTADEDFEPSCRCFIVAPCSFCETGDFDD